MLVRIRLHTPSPLQLLEASSQIEIGVDPLEHNFFVHFRFFLISGKRASISCIAQKSSPETVLDCGLWTFNQVQLGKWSDTCAEPTPRRTPFHNIYSAGWTSQLT